MHATSEMIRSQRQWADQQKLAVDQCGYLTELVKNLQQPLSVTAMNGFDRRSGGELKDTPGRPAEDESAAFIGCVGS